MAEEPEYVRAARARALTADQRNPAMRTEREVVHVAEIPTPPPTPVPAAGPQAQEMASQLSSPTNIEEVLSKILKSSAEELSAKLGGLGVRFDERCQSDMVDYCFALLAGNAGGGAIARRR